MLDTVPYLLLAVHVKHPESSANTSAMTKVQISSKANKAEMVTDFLWKGKTVKQISIGGDLF